MKRQQILYSNFYFTKLLKLHMTQIIFGGIFGIFMYQFSSFPSLSHVQLFVTPWTAACQASLSITNSWSLIKLMSIKSVMTSSHLTLCHALLFLPSIFPRIRVFSNELILHIRWPKYSWFFRIDWFDLLAVQGTLLSTKFWKHQFFRAQPSLLPSFHILTWLLEKP